MSHAQPIHYTPAAEPGMAAATRGYAVRFLAAGLALVGVGAFVAHPPTPTSPSVQNRAIQLIGTDWSQVLSAANDNFNAIEQQIAADPHPVLTQLEENWSGYMKTIQDGLQGFSHGFDKVINGVPGDDEFPGLMTLLQNVSTELQEGNYIQVFADIDTFSLDAIKPFVKPLVPILGIFDEMTQVHANLIHQLFGADVSEVIGGDDPAVYAFAKEIAQVLLAPFIGGAFQAVIDLQNDPADPSLVPDVANAILNGFTPPGDLAVDPDEQFASILGPNGTLEFFLVELPHQIAEALAPQTDDSVSAAAAESAGVGNDFGGGISTLVEPSSVADLLG